MFANCGSFSFYISTYNIPLAFNGDLPSYLLIQLICTIMFRNMLPLFTGDAAIILIDDIYVKLDKLPYFFTQIDNHEVRTF